MFRHLQRVRRGTSTRLRAVLALGVLLGAGATWTLASWTDSEFANGGTFAASTFATQSSANGTTFASNPTAPGATMTFTGVVAPTVDAYSTIDIRTTAATTVGGTVTLSSSAASGALGSSLEYRVIRTTTATTCAAAAFTGTPTFVAGTSATYIAAAALPPTPVPSPVAAAGGTIRYCFDVRAQSTASNSLQGASGTLTWKFTAVSS